MWDPVQVELSAIVAFEGTSPGASGSEPGHNKSLSSNTNLADVLSVNQLLESVIYIQYTQISIGFLFNVIFKKLVMCRYQKLPGKLQASLFPPSLYLMTK